MSDPKTAEFLLRKNFHWKSIVSCGEICTLFELCVKEKYMLKANGLYRNDTLLKGEIFHEG